MDAEELRLKCIKASEFYYNYLEQSDRGIDIIPISDKSNINPENNTWSLRIGRKLFNPDSIKIHNSRYNESYGLEHFSVREYDADNKLLIIQFIVPTNFDNTPNHNLTIISDLKFLIKKVETWYTENGHRIHLTDEVIIESNEEACVSCQLPLNTNQLEAFKNILSNKYNYVWGPPGTGKTRHVLSAAVLHYLNEDNPKIGIFAPTNNALEQALLAVLDHLDEEERKNVLRIGSPSSSYANKYPETCEIQGLEKQLKELERQIEIVKNVIEYHRGKRVFNSVFAIQNEIQKITNLNTQYRELLHSKSQSEKELAVLLKERKSLTSQLKRAINIGTVDYEHLTNQKENELAKIKSQMDKLNANVNECFLHITKSDIDTRREGIKQKIQTINIQNYSCVSEELKDFAREINDHLSVNAALAQAYSNYDEAGLNNLLAQHEKNYENLKAMRIEDRIKNCSIIGMTLDAYIGRFSDVQIDFSKIFLDEAGYAPLIKALTLFRNNCGITFLGDHKQLPPVCELDDFNDIPQSFRFLWSKPSIFAETVFTCDQEDCLNIAQDDCPNFQNAKTKQSILLESHRFGQNLAELLDRLVYDVGYRSALNDGHNVELYFVNSPNPARQTGRKKENRNECESIREILNGGLDGDYCILTPYINQANLLRTNLQEARREERITNIHKSQGKEWDTVVLSAVDGSTIEPWFTNSIHPISQGLYVLNTALSRAKKKLIIVCDVNYWLGRQDAERQLISNLIRISTQLNP